VSQAFELNKILHDKFSLSAFRKGQREIIESILAKKDVLAVLPTGGGKSLCYQFPAVYLQKLVVVISPLIALMNDQVAGLRRAGIPAGALHSGLTDSERREVFQEMGQGGPFILYLSPERAAKDGFKTWVKNRDIALFAIDEAHCVSQWGHDFREEYSQLRVLKELRPDVPTLALTASATPRVLDDITKNLALVKPERRVHGFYRPNLYYQVEAAANDDEKYAWLEQALSQFKDGRAIVYCGTRKSTEQISRFLSTKFDGVGYYHAGLSTEERTEVQNDYINGKLRILAATNAFGMGVDQADVRLVVHFQLPANIDCLYQEMGRAGRDNKPSTCLLLNAKADKGLQAYFITNSDAPKAIKDSRWRNLDALVAYAESGECHHAEVITYYKDAQRITACGHCDVCLPNSDRRIQTPQFKVNADKFAKLRKSKRRKNAILNDDLSADASERFKSLKAWRKKKAEELDQPAFVIFSDKSLRDMANKNPRTFEALRDVHGIGDAKLEKFGAELLAEILLT
jgi:ATP-dependent DNA helicase RecQ